ncbi:hypothetical protein [Salinisphaera hydrothermalis]|uniref:Lipoprotein n=1 Tax=Salinisphaera hydrothermalis (strain C41B8) TaxID=1304275 RepID=A0A084II52_SALHC|nr:hypothetical protein [Salinisphaera hydrothermalis]KEZ76386.1 hypothetical protein C41B8_15270 [Salinisphaera hydrothermalis C41B8]
MKWARRCYLIVLLLALALVATGCALHPAQEDRAAARHLVSVYNVSALLAQAAPAVSGSLNRNLPHSVALARRHRVDRLVNRTFAPSALVDDTVRRLAQAARQQGRTRDLVRASSALDQPLVRRMMALERKVGQPGFASAFKQFQNEPAGKQRKRRLRLMDQLVRDRHLAALQTRFNVTLLGAMIRARNLAVGPGARVDETQIQRILSSTRAGLQRKLAQQLPLMLLYVYRDVDTDTLERYVALQHRSATVWVNKALVRSIGRTLEAAGRSIPESFTTEEQ